MEEIEETKGWFVKKPPRAIVLHSGGLDSTVCLLQSLEKGYEPISLGIDYDQRHIIETQYAHAQCKQLGIQRKLIRISWDKPVRQIPTGRTVQEISGSVSSAFLEGRNILFLAIACAEAAGVQATEVWLGINAIDYSGYPDCTPQFIQSFEQMLNLGFPNGPKIRCPLINLTKPEIALEAARLGIYKGDTWSCYSPLITSAGVLSCGKCDACVLHDHAWKSVSPANKAGEPRFTNLSFR